MLPRSLRSEAVHAAKQELYCSGGTTSRTVALRRCRRPRASASAVGLHQGADTCRHRWAGVSVAPEISNRLLEANIAVLLLQVFSVK